MQCDGPLSRSPLAINTDPSETCAFKSHLANTSSPEGPESRPWSSRRFALISQVTDCGQSQRMNDDVLVSESRLNPLTSTINITYSSYEYETRVRIFDIIMLESIRTTT